MDMTWHKKDATISCLQTIIPLFILLLFLYSGEEVLSGQSTNINGLPFLWGTFTGILE